MNMNTTSLIRRRTRAGSALMLTLIMSSIALGLLATVMAWSSSSAKLTRRSIEYNRSLAAADAATEKVLGPMIRDFLIGGELTVSNNLTTYRQNTYPTASDSSYWGNWSFTDGTTSNRTYVNLLQWQQYTVLGSVYAGLSGYVTSFAVVSHATDNGGSQNVGAGVYQELQLTSIPIFQFTMYTSGNMEISCGQPFTIGGRVHSNQILYVEPDSSLTFQSGVEAVVSILFQRDPLDTRGAPAGTVTYSHPELKSSPVTALTLPIGTNNTPGAIREIIEPPPAGEDPASPLGKLRYYNNADILLVVTNTGLYASSRYLTTNIPSAEVSNFVSTASSFSEAREVTSSGTPKTALPIDINIGNFKTWTQTNRNVRLVGGGTNTIPNSIYVVDNRTLTASQLSAVRVLNGGTLPTNGLTVATGRPLYVQGNYNTANLPASLVGDAISVLSGAWSDANSASSLSSRVATTTTVNAAFLTGSVATTAGHYSGGMENFPRFLESWSSATFTYSGSMINMFPSLYATNYWNNNANIYNPPTRVWSYNTNFDNPFKLPPLTPRLCKAIRARWSTAAPGTNGPTTYY
jgi:hypothetical protein